MLIWNVRGFISDKKQRYLGWLIKEQKQDFILLSETKLTSPLYLDGCHSH